MVNLFIIMSLAPMASNKKSSGPSVDNYAHIGGFIGGFCISLAISRCMREDTAYEKRVRTIGVVITVIYLIISLGILGLRDSETGKTIFSKKTSA